MPFKLFSCCWKKDRTGPTPDFNNASSSNQDDLFIIPGNPRNKYALKPGHSLMDWVRLGNAGKDLTGIGKQAGKLKVTRTQLAEHCTNDDIWISLNGKVYNISYYMEFHPGGPSQLMKVAGCDATHFFNKVHPWVNYETILQKCLIGPLIKDYVDAGDITAANTASNRKQSLAETIVEKLTSVKASLPAPQPPPPPSSSTDLANEILKEPQIDLPRFDWIQKSTIITLFFYTKAYSNPLILIEKLTGSGDPDALTSTTTIFFMYKNNLYRNAIQFARPVERLQKTIVNYETGRIEIAFKKYESGIWSKFGELEQSVSDYKTTLKFDSETEMFLESQRLQVRKPLVQQQQQQQQQPDSNNYLFSLEQIQQLNHNCFLFSFRKNDFDGFYVPIGCHFNVYATIKGSKISRSYTPIPCSFVAKHTANENNCLHLLIKTYKKGSMSNHLCAQKPGYQLSTSKAIVPFHLKFLLEDFHDFVLIAAGTGITPMLGLISFLLKRSIRKSNKVQLLFFNTTERDILLKHELETLEKSDSRLTVCNILSDPNGSWPGPVGKIDSVHLNETLAAFTDIKQILFTVCGPDGFMSMAKNLLGELKITNSQIYCFS